MKYAGVHQTLTQAPCWACDLAIFPGQTVELFMTPNGRPIFLHADHEFCVQLWRLAHHVGP